MSKFIFTRNNGPDKRRGFIGPPPVSGYALEEIDVLFSDQMLRRTSPQSMWKNARTKSSCVPTPIKKWNSMTKKSNTPNWKERLYSEGLLYLLLVGIFFLFLCSLSVYRSLILGKDFRSIDYVYEGIQAFFLAKIIIIGRFLKIGERFSNSALIIPVTYKTIAFSVFIFAFTFFKHVFVGVFSGKALEELSKAFTTSNLIPILGTIPIVLFVAFPFSCLAEIGNILGKGQLYSLFFRRKKTSD
jgi:hypothetical protein